MPWSPQRVLARLQKTTAAVRVTLMTIASRSCHYQWLWLVSCLVLLASCSTSPTGRSQFILISPDAAIIESETAYLSTVRQLDDEDKLVDDPLIVARVARITGRLVSVAVSEFLRAQTGNGALRLLTTPIRSMPGAWQAAAWLLTPGYSTSLS
jgi:hypothetical protein